MKRNRIIFVLLLVVMLLCVAGCSPTSGADDWANICGSYAWDESAQYTNATLDLMWLGDNHVLFEFDLMEGSEAEDSAMELTVPGVLTVDAAGVGSYAAIAADGSTAFSIRFALEEGGRQIKITHEGELPISPDGNYTFVTDTMEASDASAKALVDHLPADDTGLSAYTLQYPDGLVGDWFYPLEAILDADGTTAATFLVAKDLSAVFRADDDNAPTLIYGSAQPMMDAESWVYEDDFSEAVSGIASMPDDDAGSIEPDEDMSDEPIPVVSVGLSGGSLILRGERAELEAYLPWALPYTIAAASADPTIAAINGTTLTAVGTGNTEIKGTITIADGKKDFRLTVSVIEEGEGRGDLIDEVFAGELTSVG